MHKNFDFKFHLSYILILEFEAGRVVFSIMRLWVNMTETCELFTFEVYKTYTARII